MQRFGLWFSQQWYLDLSSWEQELIRTSVELYSREERMKSAFQDYSFLIFPMAKAYEGFLKDFLFRVGFIDGEMYRDRRFRIGRAINPDVNPDRQGSDWVYGKLADSCGSEIARMLWNTWLESRNHIFHYFPDNEKRVTLPEAGKYLEMIASAIEQTTRCTLRTNQQTPHEVINDAWATYK